MGDQLDQLDQTAHQDHWELQPHHHHHHAQQSVSPNVSQHAQHHVAHRRSTRFRTPKSSASVEWMLALRDISSFCTWTHLCRELNCVDRLFLCRFANLTSAAVLLFSKS